MGGVQTTLLDATDWSAKGPVIGCVITTDSITITETGPVPVAGAELGARSRTSALELPRLQRLLADAQRLPWREFVRATLSDGCEIALERRAPNSEMEDGGYAVSLDVPRGMFLQTRLTAAQVARLHQAVSTAIRRQQLRHQTTEAGVDCRALTIA